MVRWMLGLVLTFALAASAPAGDDAALTDDDRRAFAWFDGLGLPSTVGKARVAVMTGRVWTDADGTPRCETARGFLLADDGDAFTVVNDGSFVQRLRRSDGAGATPVDLAADAALVLANAKNGVWLEQWFRAPDAGNDVFGGSGPGPRASLLALARRCAEHGLERQAHDLLEAMHTAPDARGALPAAYRCERIAAREFDETLIWRGTLDFGDPSIPRAQLLDAAHRFVASFPESEHLPRAEEAVKLLSLMLREEGKRAATAKPWAAMTTDERVADLIFRLRDAPGQQWMQPGRPAFFDAHPDGRPTELVELVEHGWDAVPRLIAALDDPRFTRCVGYHRDFTFSHYVKRVGDAALTALERISGRTFWKSSYTAGSMVKDGETADARRAAEAWWHEVRSRGEERFLEDVVAMGGGRGAHALRRLRTSYPETFRRFVYETLPTLADGDIGELASVLAEMPGNDVTLLLESHARFARSVRVRAIAGQECVLRGRLGVVPGLATDWRSLRGLGKWAELERAASRIVDTLARAATPEAVVALTEPADDAPAASLRILAEVLGRHVRPVPSPGAPPRSTLAAFEATLARLLADDRACGELPRGTGPLGRARVADVAASALAAAWRMPFEASGPELARDTEIAAIRAEARRRGALAR